MAANSAKAANRQQQIIKTALKAAFPYTIPVLTGFLVLGAAFGILMSTKGYGVLWAVFVSLIVFAGSMQFAAVGMLAGGLAPVPIILVTLAVNARHVFYGLSMLEKYRGAGWMKPYLIFGLCDETYAILCGRPPDEGVDKYWFMFFVTLLNQLYWVAGSALGGLIGMILPFDATGIDFALTALFIVIFLTQWQSAKGRPAALIGIASALACRLLFGAGNFLVPAMLCMLLAVTLLRRPLEKRHNQS
jgi:4-azaleucine resistance transporter AzlC